MGIVIVQSTYNIALNLLHGWSRSKEQDNWHNTSTSSAGALKSGESEPCLQLLHSCVTLLPHHLNTLGKWLPHLLKKSVEAVINDPYCYLYNSSQSSTNPKFSVLRLWQLFLWCACAICMIFTEFVEELVIRAVIALQENIDSYYTHSHFFRCCCAYNGAEVEVRLWGGSIMSWRYILYPGWE